jgi:hypothetical protein
MSYLTCPKGCLRPVSRFHNGALSFQGFGPSGVQLNESRRVSVPAAMRADYQRMIACTGFSSNPPVLEFHDDLHDVGGIFDAQHWAIFVGIKDMQRFAAEVLRRWSTRVAEIWAMGHAGAKLDSAGLFVFATEVAMRRCIAHELGHAIIFRGARNPYAPDGEAGADYYAGRLDAARGYNAELGAMFFHVIGCVGPSCTHPDPDSRAAAYQAGYVRQQNAG